MQIFPAVSNIIIFSNQLYFDYEIKLNKILRKFK